MAKRISEPETSPYAELVESTLSNIGVIFDKAWDADLERFLDGYQALYDRPVRLARS